MFCDCERNKKELVYIQKQIDDLKAELNSYGIFVYKRTYNPLLPEIRNIFNDIDMLADYLQIKFKNESPKRILVKREK